MVPLPVHHSIDHLTELAPVFARLIFDINCGVCRHSALFAQQFIFQKGPRTFGMCGDQVAIDEFDQLHHHNCFVPIDLSKLMPLEKKKAQAAMMLLGEKKDGAVKDRCVREGSKTRPHFTKEETTSPTASAEGIFITATIDAHEERDVMTADTPNAFIQASLENLMVFLSETRDNELILSTDRLNIIHWFVGTAFTIHPDFESHTAGAMTLGRGCILNGSRKQKLNTRSSMEAKLVGADNMSQLIFWTKLFMEAQGYEIEQNITKALSFCWKTARAARPNAPVPLTFVVFVQPTMFKKETSKFTAVPPTKWLPTTIPSHSRANPSISCDNNCSDTTSSRFRSQPKTVHGRSVLASQTSPFSPSHSLNLIHARDLPAATSTSG